MPKNLGERLTDSPEAPATVFGDDNAAVGTALFSTNAGVPGATFVTPLRLDTTNKHLYVWDGTQYVKVSDYA